MNELFNDLPDVLDAKALAHALSISKSGHTGIPRTFFSVFFLYLFAVLAIYLASFLHSVRCSA